jgi:hypothetical protein
MKNTNMDYHLCDYCECKWSFKLWEQNILVFLLFLMVVGSRGRGAGGGGVTSRMNVRLLRRTPVGRHDLTFVFRFS